MYRCRGCRSKGCKEKCMLPKYHITILSSEEGFVEFRFLKTVKYEGTNEISTWCVKNISKRSAFLKLNSFTLTLLLISPWPMICVWSRESKILIKMKKKMRSNCLHGPPYNKQAIVWKSSKTSITQKSSERMGSINVHYLLIFHRTVQFVFLSWDLFELKEMKKRIFQHIVNEKKNEYPQLVSH